MSQNDRGAVWFVIGVGGAVTFGVMLTPLRTLTTASTLAFVFIALTIVVAEMGGRGPGLATAVVSALSLNFFLTEPYLSLEIDKPGDVAAFVALAACGLIAAAFGKRRVRTAEQVSRTRGDLEVLGRTAASLAARAPIEDVLEDLRRFFGLGGLVLRRADERLIAAAPASQAALPPPSTQLDPSTLVASNTRVHTLGRTGFRFPQGGGRLPLQAREPLLLDMWEGNTEGLTLDERRALAVAALMIALAEPTSRA
jgi:two-component system sensor histidine kinase KdpD